MLSQPNFSIVVGSAIVMIGEISRLSSQHDLKLIRYSLVFLAGLTGTLSFLAYIKVVSSDAVLYSLGALTGSVLTLMVKFRFWAAESADEEVEG
jgi:hypothetical protein